MTTQRSGHGFARLCDLCPDRAVWRVKGGGDVCAQCALDVPSNMLKNFLDQDDDDDDGPSATPSDRLRPQNLRPTHAVVRPPYTEFRYTMES